MSGTICVREFPEAGNPVNVTQRWIERLETTIEVYEHVSRHCARRILER
ncbi:MAG TPA: hypothetical protein VM689_25400 [Aliidongia sp.]|nr:hypothetical protein [Aliidongia sp.]